MHGCTRSEQLVVSRFDAAFSDGYKNRPQLVPVGSIRVLAISLKNDVSLDPLFSNAAFPVLQEDVFFGQGAETPTFERIVTKVGYSSKTTSDMLAYESNADGSFIWSLMLGIPAKHNTIHLN